MESRLLSKSARSGSRPWRRWTCCSMLSILCVQLWSVVSRAFARCTCSSSLRSRSATQGDPIAPSPESVNIPYGRRRAEERFGQSTRWAQAEARPQIEQQNYRSCSYANFTNSLSTTCHGFVTSHNLAAGRRSIQAYTRTAPPLFMRTLRVRQMCAHTEGNGLSLDLNSEQYMYLSTNSIAYLHPYLDASVSTCAFYKFGKINTCL